MREKRPFATAGRKGFIAAEMVLLLIMLVAFVTGVVFLVDGGVSTFDSAKGQTRLSDESARILDRIGAMLGSARAISLAQPSLDPADNSGRLVFVADLEGTGGGVTLQKGADEIAGTGLETVAVYRASTRPRELQVAVADSSDRARRVTLSSMLDPASGNAFTVDYLSRGGEKIDTLTANTVGLEVGSIRVKVRLRSGRDSGSFARLFNLEKPLEARQVALDASVL